MAEFSALVALALPSMLSTYCFFAISITELSVVGHLGVDQLAAVAYAQMGLDLTTLVFMQGFNAGMTALCSQAFGAKNYHLLGRYTMLTGFCLTIMCVPMAILWWNLGAILSLAGRGVRSLCWHVRSVTDNPFVLIQASCLKSCSMRARIRDCRSSGSGRAACSKCSRASTSRSRS